MFNTVLKMIHYNPNTYKDRTDLYKVNWIYCL